ncbi:MAG TPA: MFS transporter, partial [Stellaceae bacterium]|nr:MFS transporter [Stellaceae bacterium]
MAVLFLIVFIDLLGFGIIIPQLPFYGVHFGASPTAVTLLMSCYSFAQFFMSPVLGRLSDRIGRRPVLMVSMACSCLAYVWLGFASALWMLFGARLLAGAGAGNLAAAQAYITDVTSPEARAKGMGMIGAAFGLGFTLGPWLGGVVAGTNPTPADLQRPAFLAAALSALAFVLVIALLKESLTRTGAPAPRASRWDLAKSSMGRPMLRLLILLFFAITAAFSGMETTFALWTKEAFGWGPAQVGWLFFFVGCVLIVVQGVLIGPLSRRLGEARLVLIGAASIAVGLATITVSSDLAMLLVASACLAVGMGLLNPSINSLISRQAGVEERGGIMGVSQSGASLARVVGPAIAGPLFELIGRNAPYYAGALVMLG